MTRKKFFLLFSFLFALALIGAQCAGGAPTAAPTQAPAAEATTAPAAGAEFVCDDPLGCVDVEAGAPIKIASALVISGPNTQLGLDSQRGVEIAIEDRGQVLGHSVELAAEDDGCSAEGGQTAATKIASDPEVVAIVGHSCSSSCTPAAPIYDGAGMTMISPSCTAPALTAEASHVASFLRTAHNDNVQGRVMAEFVYNELGLRSAATIHDGSPYAEQLQQVFADTFRQLGGEITDQAAVNVGDTDMRPLLTSIGQKSPEFLYYPIFTAEGAFVTVQAKEVPGLENTVLAGADGMISPDFLAAAGEAAEGMYISGPDLAFTGGKYEHFLEVHQQKYGEAPLSAFHAHAYDAANMVFDAIEQVAVQDADGTLHIGRQALRDALFATANFDGITGNLSCGPTGDCADPKIAVNQVQNGAYVPVFPTAEGAAGGEAMMAHRYGMVTDVGGIDDKGFNQISWEGMVRAQDELGVEVAFLESQQQTDYEKNINEFLGQGYNGIVTVGFLLGDATKAASEANPDIPFAIVDFPSQTSGDLGLLFAVDQPSFVAGYLAAGMSESGIVCTYGGIKIPPVVQFMVAYEHGVMYYNEVHGTDVQVLGWKTDPAAEGGGDGSFTGNFESTEDGRRFAENFFDEGCDIIFPVAGPVGIGSAAATQDRGFTMIGVDTDYYERFPETQGIYLTSVLKNIDVAVFTAIQAMEDGSFAGGTNYLGTFDNGGVGIAPYHDFEDQVPDDLKAEVADLTAQVAAGAISTGWPVGE